MVVELDAERAVKLQKFEWLSPKYKAAHSKMDNTVLHCARKDTRYTFWTSKAVVLQGLTLKNMSTYARNKTKVIVPVTYFSFFFFNCTLQRLCLITIPLKPRSSNELLA